MSGYHADGAVREVDDSRPAVDKDDALRGKPVARAGPETQDREPQDLGHELRFM